MTIGYDQSKFVNESISEIRFALTVSMILVILIITFFFLVAVLRAIMKYLNSINKEQTIL